MTLSFLWYFNERLAASVNLSFLISPLLPTILLNRNTIYYSKTVTVVKS